MGGSDSKEVSQDTLIVDEFISAAEAGDVAKLRDVLTSGLPINAPGSNGYPALYGAIKKSRTDIVNELLSIDAIDVNVKNSATGKTVLMLASELGQNSIVSLLVDRKVKLDEKDVESEWSALHYAVYNNHIGAATILLDAGADINIQDCSNQTSLHITCYKDFEDMTRLLLARGIDYNILDNEGLDALKLSESDTVRDIVLFFVNQRGEGNSVPGV